MNLKQLEAFVKVTESGSFSKAAKLLFLTQPTVSAHISSLEKELDSRLFVRNTKEVKLLKNKLYKEKDKGFYVYAKTEIQLYQYARQMVELEKEIEQVFSKDAHREEKCITIATSTIPAQYVLPAILAKFRETYPDEQFRISENDSCGVVEQVAGHMVDIGFTGTVLEKKHCRYMPFYQDELVVIMPNTEFYQEIQKRYKTATWIKNEPVIMREEGSGTRKETEKILRKAGIMPDTLNIVACIENPEAIKRSVKSGLGITIISRLAAEEEIRTGQVLEFPLQKDESSRYLNLVYNKNYQLPAAAEHLIRIVKDFYPDAHMGK